MSQVQSTRIEGIDFARGISVFMVILVHTLWMNGTIPVQEGWLGNIIHFIGKGTGMFLITMGVSFMVSRNNSALRSIRRGVLLLLVAYAMNFLKFVLPIILGIMPEDFIRAYGWKSPLNSDQYIYLITTGDILQLAGYALLIMGLMRRFFSNKYVYLIAAGVVIISTVFLRGLHTGHVVVDYFLDLLCSNNWHVYFSLFPWMSFIFIGMFFGALYVEKGRSLRAFHSMLPVGLVLFIAGIVFLWMDFDFHFGNFYHLGPGGSIYLIGFNLLLIRLAFFTVKVMPLNKFKRVVYYMSSRVTSLYFIQWVLICWGMALFGYQKQPELIVILLMIFYVVLTFSVQKIMDGILFRKKKKQVKTQVIVQ
ncbi:hypothetical protein D3C71_968400 [compost metagenome]